jgi:hypothetical protein
MKLEGALNLRGTSATQVSRYYGDATIILEELVSTLPNSVVFTVALWS